MIHLLRIVHGISTIDTVTRFAAEPVRFRCGEPVPPHARETIADWADPRLCSACLAAHHKRAGETNSLACAVGT